MSRTLAITLAFAVSLAAADPASAQKRDRPSGQTSGGRATPRTEGSSPRESAPSGGGGDRSSGGSTGSTGSGTSVASSGAGDSGQAARRRGDGSGTTGAPSVRGADNRDNDSDRGRAVARRPGSRPPTTVVVRDPGYYGGFYPWGYGGLGLGGYYGWYDPWYDDPPYGYGGGYGYGYGDEGSLRLKMKPRDASVYVDGYFAGVVDDYDGVFQRLSIDAGPHRVEVREDGFEPLMFEVRIQPGRTVTYQGALKRLP